MSASSRPAWNALQAAAILLLCRMSVFFCSTVPYTADCARGFLTSAIFQAALVLPLLRYPAAFSFPRPVLWLYRAYAVFWAARLTALLYGTLQAIRAPHPAAILGLLLLTLCYTVSRPQAATARAAVILLAVLCAGLLFLPVSGIRSAHLISLQIPGDAANAFLQDWRLSGELGMLPLLLTQMKEPRSEKPRRAVLAWALGKGIVLPALVLFGAMQNGRLTHLDSNPFFLLLARTPLSDAVRTDGFWMLLAVAAAVLCISFYLQNAKPAAGHAILAQVLTLLPAALLTVCMIVTGYDGRGLGIAAIVLGAVVPYAGLLCRLVRCRLHRRKGDPHEQFA